MERTNALIVEDSPGLRELANNCARLWNEVNFERRQAYVRYKKFSWYPKHLYEKYAPMVGSATAQQIINKNNEAWKSFLELKKLEASGKLPPNITRVSMPRYWKRNGKRELRVIVRNDCYKVDLEYLYLPKGLKLRYKGELKWKGKRSRLEIAYDDVDEVWRGFMSVKVEEPPKGGGSKSLYIDLGVVNLATVWARELKQPMAFSGRATLADWWYWARRIAKEQSRLARVNRTKTSRGLRRMYRIRQRRFKHAVNAMVKRIVDDAYELGLSKIILGKLKGVRNNNHNNGKANAMVNNFWSFEYIIRRFKEKAEEYGIEVELLSEYQTSSLCPTCNVKGVRRYRGLFYCPNCDKAINADVVGALNIAKGKTIIPSPSWDRDNGLVAQPLLLRWNGMNWEPRRAMSIRPMKTLGARISRL